MVFLKESFCNIYYDYYYFLNLSDFLLKGYILNINDLYILREISLCIKFNQIYLFNIRSSKVLFSFLIFFFLFNKIPVISFNKKKYGQKRSINNLVYKLSNNYKYILLLNCYLKNIFKTSRVVIFKNYCLISIKNANFFFGFSYFSFNFSEFFHIKLTITITFSKNCNGSLLSYFLSSFNIFI